MPVHVDPFFHDGSNTWTYVVREPEGAAAAIIDPVLDFDAASGRTSVESAQAVLDFVRSHALDVQWILETHAHADHLSAGHWLKSQLPTARLAIGAHGAGDFPADLQPRRALPGGRLPVRPSVRR
jgi:glyoxylase-like metal-dependent hydrolase (beta-lactamase superfamily II)